LSIRLAGLNNIVCPHVLQAIIAQVPWKHMNAP
jgi:hypothetical protein